MRWVGVDGPGVVIVGAGGAGTVGQVPMTTAPAVRVLVELMEVSSVSSNKMKNTGLLLAGTLSLALVLGACSSPGAEPEVTAEPTPSATATPSPESTAEPEEAPEPEPVEESPGPQEPEVVADEYSQVIDGVLYQGTEKAPVRIGDDTPGQPPAIDGQVTVENWDTLPVEANKYLLHVGYSPGHNGYFWKVWAVSRFGTYREVANNGYDRGHFFGSVDDALASAIVVDDRELDRAEYAVFVQGR